MKTLFRIPATLSNDRFAEFFILVNFMFLVEAFDIVSKASFKNFVETFGDIIYRFM